MKHQQAILIAEHLAFNLAEYVQLCVCKPDRLINGTSIGIYMSEVLNYGNMRDISQLAKNSGAMNKKVLLNLVLRQGVQQGDLKGPQLTQEQLRLLRETN